MSESHIYVRLGDTTVAVHLDARIVGGLREKLTRYLVFETDPCPHDAVIEVFGVAGAVPTKPQGRVREASGEGWAFWWDGKFGTAFFNTEKALAPWHIACPFRQLFAWQAQLSNSMLVHASAVVHLFGNAALFVGPGGSGKSTLARSLCKGRESFLQLGDDWVSVSGCRVSPLYTSVKLDPKMFEYLKEVPLSEERALSSNGKLVYDAIDPPGRGYAIGAVIVPKIAEQGVALRPISSSDAVLAMAPSTLLQSSGVDSRALRNMVALCNSVPCYELSVSIQMLPAASGIVKELT